MIHYEEARFRAWPLGNRRYLVSWNGRHQAFGVAELAHDPDWYWQRMEELLQQQFEDGGLNGAVVEATRKLGRMLFEAFFVRPGKVLAAYEKSLADLPAGHRLRISLRLHPDLDRLPLELMCLPADGGAPSLALDARLSFVRTSPRRIGQSSEQRAFTDGEPFAFMRVLVVFAAPVDRAPIQGEEEFRAVQEAVEGPNSEAVLVTPPTLAEIERRCRAETLPCALLVIAHGELRPGGEGAVLLEDNDRRAVPVTGQVLAEAILRAPKLRMVMLNLCRGAQTPPGEPFLGVAQALHAKGVPAVVGVPFAVSDDGALRLSPPVFEALTGNETIDFAVSAGRRQVSTGRAQIEWASPVLYLDPCFGHGWLFKVNDFTEAAPMDDPHEEYHRLASLLELGQGARPDMEYIARWARLTNDWRVVDKVSRKLLRSDAISVSSRATYSAWKAEAEFEEQVQVIDEACRAQQPERLAGVAAGAEVAEILGAEIRDVRVRQQLHEARRAAEAGDWKGACDLWKAVAGSTLWSDGMASERAYAMARLAESKEDWQGALDSYALVRDRPDSALRVAWIHGRIREQAHDWQAASDAFRRAGAHADGPVRARFTGALQGLVDHRWSLAASELQAVVDDRASRYQASEVRQCLAFAKAGALAFGPTPDWSGVVEALADVFAADFAFADAVVALRHHARGRLHLDKREWLGILALTEGDRSPANQALVAIANAQLAFEGGRWEALARAPGVAARQALCGCGDLELPSAVRREASVRRAFGKAMVAEGAEQWLPASRWFAVLAGLPGHSMAAECLARHAYAAGRHAVARSDWDAAVAAFERCDALPIATPWRALAQARRAAARGDFPRARDDARAAHAEGLARQVCTRLDEHLANLAGYAAGRIAETAGDWRTAAQEYATCGPFEDAPQRRAYVAGRLLETAGDWSAAIAAWQGADARDTDASVRSERLQTILARLPWLDGLPGAGLVPDPLASTLQASPYELLRRIAITPQSPAAAVHEAQFTLIEAGELSPVTQAASNQLRSTAGRLAVDATMYPIGDPEQLRAAMASMAGTNAQELLEDLTASAGADAGVLWLLASHPDRAAQAWWAALATNGMDGAALHGLSMANWWRARAAEATGAEEQAQAAWRRVIAWLAPCLAHEDHWRQWRRQRAAAYRTMLRDEEIARLRQQLADDLREDLVRCAVVRRNSGRMEAARIYDDLVSAWAVEQAAVRECAALGGIASLVGPSLLVGLVGANERGLGPRISGWIHGHHEQWSADADDGPTEFDALLGDERGTLAGSSLRGLRVRLLFSSLGPALMALVSEPERTLRLAAACVERGPEPECAAEARRVRAHQESCEPCRRLTTVDLGYEALDIPAKRRHIDAVMLLVAARLRLARQRLGEPDPLPAVEHLSAAIAAAKIVAAHVRTKVAVARLVQGRAKGLAAGDDAQQGARMTTAIALVEKTRELVGTADGGQLAATHAELLTDRGVWFGYGCHAYEAPDLVRAAVDLRAALRITPTSLHARDNLVRALMFHGHFLGATGRQQQAAGEMAEAMDVLAQGLRAGRPPQLVRLLRDLLDELEQWSNGLRSFDEIYAAMMAEDTGAVPRGPSAMVGLAPMRALLDNGKPLDALRHCIQALRALGDQAGEVELLDLARDAARKWSEAR